jgi:Leucine-rich repeat (LRR) protein
MSFSSETLQSPSCFTSTLIGKVKLLRVRLAQFAFSIISPTSINVHVGSSNGSDYFFIGLIDDVRIYNRALSAAEVKEFEKPKTQQASTPTSTKAVPHKLIADPIVEKAIRERRQIRTGVLTKADLERVEYLNLTSTKITDASLTEVAKLTQLKSLYLNDTKITDVGLKKVAEMKQLTSLYFKDTQITDVGVKEVAKMKQLTTLDLRATKVTKAVVRRLQKTLPKCKIYGNAKK